jgi:hypothetical protein
MDAEDGHTDPSLSSSSSLTAKLMQLSHRLLYDIWSSPINLVLVGLIVCLLIKLVLLKRKSSSGRGERKSAVPLPRMAKCDFTVPELRGYNGIESNGRILTAIHGDIFDVSSRSDLYGIGAYLRQMTLTSRREQYT